MAEEQVVKQSEEVVTTDEATPEPAGLVPAVDDETQKKLNKDLKLKRVGLVMASMAESEKRLNPEGFESRKKANEPIFDFEEVFSTASQFTGLTPEEYKQAAQFQGAPLQKMYEDIVLKERPVQKVLDEYKTQETLWSKTEQQRNVLSKGQKTLEKGFERVATREKKLSPEQRQETLIRLLKSKDPTNKIRLFTGSEDDGEAEDAVIKPDQPEFSKVVARADAIVDPKKAADSRRAEIWQKHLQDLGPITMGSMLRNTISERAFLDMTNDVLAYDVNREAKRRGIQRGQKGYDEIVAAKKRDVYNQVALLRSAQKFLPPAFVQWDDIDPEGWLGAVKDTENESWLSQALAASSKARVEIIGVDPKGVPVYRIEHPAWHMFEIADSPQAMAVGIAERLADDEIEESLGETIKRGSVAGLRNRRDIFKAGLSTEAAKEGGLKGLAVGGLALGGAVLAPDLFLGTAAAARGAKRVGDALATAANIRRTAPTLIDAFADGAQNLAKAEDVLRAAEKAVADGRYDEAIQLIDDAAALTKKSDNALATARTADSKVAQVVDQIDMEIAQRMAKRQVPEMLGATGMNLAAKVPGSFGETAQNIHPSARRLTLRGESPDQFVGFEELLSSTEALDSLKEAVQLLRGGEIDKAYTVRVRVDAGRPFADAVREQMFKFGVHSLDDGLTDAQRQVSLNLQNYLDSPASTRLLRDNPKEWRQEVMSRIDGLAFRDQELKGKFTAAIQKLFKIAEKDAAKAARSTKRITLEEARKATALATKAVRANLESRAAASAFVREQVADRAKIAAEPILVKLTDKYQAVGRERLAPEALRFMDEVVDIYPELEGDDALKIARLLDKEMRKIARSEEKGKGARTLSDTFKQRLKGLIQETSESKAAKQADAAVPPPPPKAPDTAATKAPDAPPPASVPTPSAGQTTEQMPEGLRRAMRGSQEQEAALDRELKALTATFPEGKLAAAPKRKPLPDLDTKVSDTAQINRQATFGSTPDGLTASEIYDHTRNMTSAVEVAEFLTKHAVLAQTRLVMKRILPTLRKSRTKFEIVDDVNDTVGELLSAQGAIGRFNPSDNVVSIRGANWPANGLSEEVITHELLHAATAKFIRQNPSNKAVKEIASLNTEVMNALKKQLDTLTGPDRDRVQNVIINIGDSVDEFVSYALTNPRFQMLLNEIELAPKKTVWNAFTRALAKLFGFRGDSETNALARAMVATDSLLRESKQFNELVDTAVPVVLRADDEVSLITSPYLQSLGDGKGGMILRNEIVFDVPVLRVDGAEISQFARGRGLGVDVYLRALRHAQDKGVGFLSDVRPNENAMRVYRALEDLGIKFTRKPVPDDTGELADAFFISPKDLAKLKLDQAVIKNNELRIAKRIDDSGQVSLFAKADRDFVSDPLIVEFLENGQAIIKAIGETATVDDFIRAIGKIARRDLDEKGMKAVVAWLSGRGIKVGYNGASFTADDVATVERAEEEFARAFAEYVESGRADKPELNGPFSDVREWLSDTYAALRGAEADGAALDMDEGLRRSLDELLRVPAERTGMPNILALMKEALISPKLGGTTVEVVDEILKEGFRLGSPINETDLRKQFDRARQAYEAGRPEDAIIKLPIPISIHLNKGKKEWTLDELMDAQLAMEQAKRMETHDVGRIPLGGAAQTVRESKPSDIFDQMTMRPGLGKAIRGVFLGGDAFSDMRGLPPIVRDGIMAGVRRVQQAVGDAVTMVAEGDIVNLTRLVTGQPDVRFAKGGRAAISAGHDSMASVSNMISQYFTRLDDPTKDVLIRYVQKVQLTEPGTPNRGAKAILDFSPEDRKVISDAFDSLVNGAKASRFISEVFQAARLKKTRLDPKYLTKPTDKFDDPGGLLEIILYYGNVVTRTDPKNTEGLLFSERYQRADASEVMFRGIYNDIQDLFAGEDVSVANRVAILIHAHGTAIAAKKDWVDMGMAADEKLAKSMKQFIVGEAIDPEDTVRVKNAFESLGYNPAIVEGYDLNGVKMYIPQAARNRLDMALSQAQDPELIKIDELDTISALNRVFNAPDEIIAGKGTNSSTALSFALFYRYIKTRMVRGHFVLKSRYFWMNTFDHFNQVATRAGFRTALISASRMVTQNMLANPAGQAAVFAARRAGKGESVEAFRRALQDMGDEGAKWAGKLTRGSKWNIKLNPILEGRAGMVMLGGKPYRNQDIRRIALEAGIFASFDTSQLGTKLQNVGNLFLQEANKSGRLTEMGKDILGDMKGSAEDIAEAWAERERLGCMITLMEAGIDPRTAAKISIEALYDYAGSMSKADRNFLLNLFLPFWAFQKNANRQIFDTIFSPQGAYRLGVMRRAYDNGSEFLSQLTYEAAVDEYGVATDALPPELRDTYFAIKKGLLDTFGENGRVPAVLQEQIRLYIAMSNLQFTGGKAVELDPDIEKAIDEVVLDTTRLLRGNDPKNLGIDRRALSSYYVARPDKAALPSYQRNRISWLHPYVPEDYEAPRNTYEVPEDFQRSTKVWNDLYRARNPEAPYFAFFMPEPTYAAAFNHFAYLFSVGALTAQKIEDMGDRWFTDEDDGSDAISPLGPLNALLNPTRAPVLSDLMATMGMGGATMPKRVHPDLVYYYEMFAIDVLELDEKEDLNNLIFEQKVAEEKGEQPEELPTKVLEADIRPGKKYYMMPGVAQLIFVNSPLGELNDLLLRSDKTGAEQAAGVRGDIQQFVRIATGLDMRDVDRKRTALQESIRAQEASPAVMKKLRAREKPK